MYIVLCELELATPERYQSVALFDTRDEARAYVEKMSEPLSARHPSSIRCPAKHTIMETFRPEGL